MERAPRQSNSWNTDNISLSLSLSLSYGEKGREEMGCRLRRKFLWKPDPRRHKQSTNVRRRLLGRLVLSILKTVTMRGGRGERESILKLLASSGSASSGISRNWRDFNRWNSLSDRFTRNRASPSETQLVGGEEVFRLRGRGENSLRRARCREQPRSKDYVASPVLKGLSNGVLFRCGTNSMGGGGVWWKFSGHRWR